MIQLGLDGHFYTHQHMNREAGGTSPSKVEEWRESKVSVCESSCIGESSRWVSEFVKEFLGEGVESRETFGGGVLQ